MTVWCIGIGLDSKAHKSYMMKLDVVLLTNCHTEIQILVHNTNTVISNKEPIDALLNSIVRKYHERIK